MKRVCSVACVLGIILGATQVGLGDAGKLYKQGAALFKSDPGQACTLFEQAAEGGNVSAMVGAGHCYESGEGTAVDYAKALSLYEQAAKLGSLKGCEGLARIYASCPDSEFHDGEKAVRFASMVAKKRARDNSALALLASAYARNVEFDKALKAQSQAVRCSGSMDLNELEIWIDRYAEGMPNPSSASEAWYLEAADKASGWAMVQVGNQFLGKDDALARMWFERAAEAGSAESALAAGKLYWMGFGGERDMAKALELFILAKEGGSDEAAFWAGYAYICMRRDFGDISKAQKYFDMLDGDEDSLAQAFLKILSHSGWRDSLKDKAADHLYDFGVTFSMPQKKTVNTALYENAPVIKPADHPRAIVCFMIAAESGYKKAQGRVLTLLSKGETDLAADPDLAELWRRRMRTPGSFSSLQ